MTEPLTIFAAAGNALQFIELGVKLTRSVVEYSRAADGLPAEHHDLLKVVTMLHSTCEQLEAPACDSTSRRKELQKAIESMNQECLRISKDFVSIVDSLKVEGTPTAWKSLKTTFKSLREGTKIASISQRLSQARGNLLVALMIWIE